MIHFVKPEGWKVLELGCGANPHPLSDCRVDVRSVPGVTDFTCDFNKEKWDEIGSEGFEIVLAIFLLEHISWRNIPNALRETLRILKPGGKCLFVIPNTEAQIKWIAEKGWEQRGNSDGPFIESSRILYGDLDYPENSHRSFFSPSIIMELFSKAGFNDVFVTPFGITLTDMVVEAKKKEQPSSEKKPLEIQPLENKSLENKPPEEKEPPLPMAPSTPPPLEPTPVSTPIPIPTEEKTPYKPENIFNFDYFDNYQGGGFYWNYPSNFILSKKILAYSPISVLELGCARGYLLKYLEDANIPVRGIDVSRHAYGTRVSNQVKVADFTSKDSGLFDYTTNTPLIKYDLALSICTLEHIPETLLPTVFDLLAACTNRGVHGVVTEEGIIFTDATRCTVKPLAWWKERMPPNQEVYDIRELSAGDLTAEYLQGDGRIKLNLGCAWTMFPFGWQNIDIVEGENFARTFHYRFLKHDLRSGLPLATGVADLLFSHHMLEHLTYEEGLRFLRECRRIIRNDGVMRVVVPSADRAIMEYRSSFRPMEIYDEVNKGSASSSLPAVKLWAMLGEGHKAFYNQEALEYQLREAGFIPVAAKFRSSEITTPNMKQLLRETTEMDYGISLFCDAIPST